MKIRQVELRDREDWARMREALWPEAEPGEHVGEVDSYLAGGSPGAPDIQAVFIADDDGRAVGFLELSVREWGVLEYLLHNAGRVVSKQQIIDAIAPWGDDLTLNAVEVYVSRLRLKIEGAGVLIRTVRGFGYLLEAGG